MVKLAVAVKSFAVASHSFQVPERVEMSAKIVRNDLLKLHYYANMISILLLIAFILKKFVPDDDSKNMYAFPFLLAQSDSMEICQNVLPLIALK